MDVKGFQVWLSAAHGLTRAQRREALAVLSGRSEGEASKAAIELGVDEARRCPHCASEGAVSRGMARGLRRYQCKGCGRTFNALTGTPLSGLHHKERWLSFGCQRRRDYVPGRRRKIVPRARWQLVPVVHGRDPRAGRRALRAAGGGARVGGASGPTRASGGYSDGRRRRDRLCLSR